MNAPIGQFHHPVEDFRWRAPEAALGRLNLRLERERAAGGAWEASLSYGVPLTELCELVDYWCDEFDYRAQEARLRELPCFQVSSLERKLCFLHLRSSEEPAIPLLLLHGYSGSILEFQGLLEALIEPRAHAGSAAQAFHVICPSLPGFGLTATTPAADLRSTAEACAALMARLGYSRYVAHGNDLGAAVASELGLIDAEHVAGIHVTSLSVFPSTDDELTSLSSQEKSQLALLTELYEQRSWQMPRSPIEELAFAVMQLADAVDAGQSSDFRDLLLTGLTLNCLNEDSTARARLYRQSKSGARRSRQTPSAVCAFPLDTPSLRRLAEREHRIVAWTEHERGGCLPALEQPELLLGSLRNCLAHFEL